MNFFVKTFLLVLTDLSSIAFAYSRVEGESGSYALMTRTNGDFFDCENVHIERRISANLKPSWVTRDRTFSANLNGLALVSNEGDPQIFDSGMDLNYRVRSGRHQTSISGSGSYQDQILRYGCSSEMDQRLKRKRAESDGSVLTGRSLKTYTAAFEHQMGKSYEKIIARYVATKSFSAGFDQRHELSLRSDHVHSESIAVSGGFFVASARGDLDEFMSSGVDLGIALSISRRLALNAEGRVEKRTDGSRALSASSIATYKISPSTDLLGRINQSRFFREARNSVIESELGSKTRFRRTVVDFGVHRVDLKRSERASDLWYSSAIQQEFAESQTFDITMSTGNPYPDQSSQVTTFRCAYGLMLGQPKQSLQITPERRSPQLVLDLGVGYSYSLLVDLVSRKMATRQWLWSLKVVF